MWTVDHEADIASDLSAFHRIDDPMTVDGPRYFSLAIRLGAYAGVIAARMAKIREDEKEGRSGDTTSTAANPSRVNDDAALAMLDAGWVERVTTEEED